MTTNNPFDSIEKQLLHLVRNIDELMLHYKSGMANPEPTKKELKTRKEAAAFLGITLPTLHKMTHDGRIQGRRIGSRIRFYQSDLEKALKAIKSK
jgi:excisionase family DNA binding protein